MKKLFLKVVIVLVVVIICSYFVVTNSLFIRTIVLPIISSSAGANITVTTINVSPIKGQLSFNNMRIKQEDNISIDIAHFDTQLDIFDLFKNKLTINNLNLENSYIKITQSTYSGQQASDEQKNVQPVKEVKTDANTKLYKLSLKDIKIKNLNISYSLLRENSQESSVSEIKNLNIDIPYFKTEGKGALNFSSNIITSTGSNTLSGSVDGKLNTMVNEYGVPRGFDMKATLKLGQDTTPINCVFNSTREGAKLPFTASLSISNLLLQPFFQAFVKGTYQKTNGYIKNLDIHASAPDLYSKNIFQTLNGNLILFSKDIYIPSDLLKNPLIQIMLIPLDVISKFDSASSIKLFSNNSTIIKSASSKILTGEKSLEFKTGEIKLSMKDGDTTISNFEFDGTSKNAIQKITIRGTINKNQQIDLNTITTISGISIPLRLRGTLTNPQHESIELIRGIINQNIDTIDKIIDVSNKNNNVKQTTKSIINTINNITKEGSEKASDDLGSSVGNLIKGIKNLTD